MQKIYKFFSIVITTILTLTNLWQIVPDKSDIKSDLNELFAPMLTNEAVCFLIGGVLVGLGFLVVIMMVYELKNAKNEHTFSVGSYGFRHFFSKWYSQPGALSIICDDLQGWLVSEGKEDVLDALREKSKKKELHLILGKEIPMEIVNELKTLGAVVYYAPPNIISNYSFSCISVMGNNAAVIVRNKQKDEKNIIKIEEISNTYVTGLLNVLIENIKGETV